MSRRLNFLWYLVHQKEDSLLSKFFKAQVDDPIKGDWASQVKEDMTNLNMEMTFDDLKALSKETFKQTIKKHVRETAFKGLKEIQDSHSKSKKIDYKEMKMHEYLSADNGMTIKEKSFAFWARSQMLDVKSNFKVGKLDLKCSLGCDITEDQEHIFHCPVLKEKDEKDFIDYKDIYGQDPIKVKEITLILMTKFAKFTKLKTTVHGQTPQTMSSAAESEDTVNNVNTFNSDDIVDCSDSELE